MDNVGWWVFAIVLLQVICHVANTFIREYYNRLDRVLDLLRKRGLVEDLDHKKEDEERGK